MRVLITERTPGDAVEVAQRLGAAGFRLSYCHRPDEHSHQCPGGRPGERRDAGLLLCTGVTSGGRCPLSDGDVDVVVDARGTAESMTAREFGALCALRHHTPLVLAGPLADDAPGIDRWADVRCRSEDVVGACERAVSPTGPTAHRAAAEAARHVLRQSGHDAALTVALRTRDGVVDAFVTSNRPLPARLHEEIREMIRASLSTYTRSWPYAQVLFMVTKAT